MKWRGHWELSYPSGFPYPRQDYRFGLEDILGYGLFVVVQILFIMHWFLSL